MTATRQSVDSFHKRFLKRIEAIFIPVLCDAQALRMLSLLLRRWRDAGLVPFRRFVLSTPVPQCERPLATASMTGLGMGRRPLRSTAVCCHSQKATLIGRYL
jgi:hypothetical protein